MNRNTKINETADISKTADIDKNMRKSKKAHTNRQIISVILLAALVIAFISGILIRPLGDSMIMLAVHKLSALILVICSMFHILQYKKRKEVPHVS